MKTKHFFLLIFITINTFAMAQKTNSKLWSDVDSLQKIGQYKSAENILNKIYTLSKESDNNVQMIKSMIYKIKFANYYKEQSFDTAISEIKTEIETAKSPAKQILYSMLAEVYEGYFNANQWNITKRTPLEVNLDDFETWDAAKFGKEISLCYKHSLENAETLKNTDISEFSVVLEGDSTNRNLRPTLYDLLAHRAIEFFSNPLHGVISKAEAFKIDKEIYFGDINSFIKINFDSKDTLSFDYLGLQIFKELLSYHLSKNNTAALIDANLQRLIFVNNRCVLGAQKDELYENALRGFYNKYSAYPESADIAYSLANNLYNAGLKYVPFKAEKNKNKLKEAVEICDETIKRYPNTIGCKNCEDLKKIILTKNIDITTNYAIVPNSKSLLLLEYKNTETVYFRIYKADPFDDYRERNSDKMKEDFKKLFSSKPVQAWENILPNENDYQKHKTEIVLPELPIGYYTIIASTTKDFDVEKVMEISNVFYSDIAYSEKSDYEQDTEVFVYSRSTGKPIAGATIDIYYKEYSQSKRETVNLKGNSYVTDKDGKAKLTTSDNFNQRNVTLVFSKGKDVLHSENNIWLYKNSFKKEKKETRTFIFTDRSIYRPGQTVYYKGIVLDELRDKKSINTSFSGNIKLKDVNRKEVSSNSVSTNEFGSFSGSFNIPTNVLTGRFEIVINNSNIYIDVEEYKRPSFEIDFPPITQTFKLNENVTVNGNVKSYSGAPVSDAQVTFHVKRSSYSPYRFYWWMPIYSSNDVEITSGVVTSNEKGDFEITFNALADKEVDPDFNPVYVYTIEAVVMDITGETHEKKTSIQISNKSLIVSTNIGNDVSSENFKEFVLKTNNLNGQPQSAKGNVIISKLNEPKTVLFPRKWERPDLFVYTKDEFKKLFPNDVYDNEDDIKTWQKEKTVFSYTFETPTDSLIKLNSLLDKGYYMVEVKTTDIFNNEIYHKEYFQVFNQAEGKSDNCSPAFFKSLTEKAEPGDKISFIVGTPLKNVHTIFEIANKNGVVLSKMLNLNNQQTIVDYVVKEEDRGGLKIQMFFTKENNTFETGSFVVVPFSNKELDIQISNFRSKLMPGENEEWKITIKNPDKTNANAEFLATMYDASLDAFSSLNWHFDLYKIYGWYQQWRTDESVGTNTGYKLFYDYITTNIISRSYESLIDMGLNYGGYRNFGGIYFSRAKTESMDYKVPMNSKQANDEVQESLAVVEEEATTAQDASLGKDVEIRKNFNENAFFYPQLKTNENGELQIAFQIPEINTKWRLLGLAHTKDLKIGQIEKTLVTQKDLMVYPNVPRFVREGDELLFSAKITNLSDKNLNGKATLQILDAYTMKPVNELFENFEINKDFSVNAQNSTLSTWKLKVPKNIQAIVYRIVAQTDKFSDGEEAMIPVLSNRMMVTEAMPLPINSKSEKIFTFDKFVNNKSTTIDNFRLTLEYTSNPAWYAVQAIPYLMEYPYDCSEQIFNRLYANAISKKIVDSNDDIKRVFELWKSQNPNASLSNLEKNQELKSVVVEETPWLREAKNEAERKANIAILFNENRVKNEIDRAMSQLQKSQYGNGAWSWFPGMRESEFITQYIVVGFGKLEKMNVINFVDDNTYRNMVYRAIDYLDSQKLDYYKKLIANSKKDDLKKYSLSYNDIYYLYARSFFVKRKPFSNELQDAVNFFLKQSENSWLQQNNFMKGMIAVYLNRLNKKDVSKLIIKSLEETATYHDELGMYWKKPSASRYWSWYQAPIEEQAQLIEAFDEVSNNTKLVDEMKKWLLKQKQTQNWNSTKSTADAIYALLMRGADLLKESQPVSVKIDGKEENPAINETKQVEFGTGYFKTSWENKEISPKLGEVKVSNPNNNIAWGAMYWQYFEDLDKITEASTGFKIQKKLYREVNSETGPVLKEITENQPITVGDKVVVRVILTTDRDLEYVHLKDMRASAFEPVDVISGYRWQQGLGYYQSMRDASANFFISYLAKGQYVFEYKLFATQKGKFSNGITTAQCMYAPEFVTHSEGITVEVK